MLTFLQNKFGTIESEGKKLVIANVKGRQQDIEEFHVRSLSKARTSKPPQSCCSVWRFFLLACISVRHGHPSAMIHDEAEVLSAASSQKVPKDHDSTRKRSIFDER